MGSFTAYGNVALIGYNGTLSFPDIEANFGEFYFFILVFLRDRQLLLGGGVGVWIINAMQFIG